MHGKEWRAIPSRPGSTVGPEQYNPVTPRHQETEPGRDRLLEAEGINPAEVLGIDCKVVKEQIFRRDDRRVLAGARDVKEQVGMERAGAEKVGRNRQPKPGDLVLLRDIQLPNTTVGNWTRGGRLRGWWCVFRLPTSRATSGNSSIHQLSRSATVWTTPPFTSPGTRPWCFRPPAGLLPTNGTLSAPPLPLWTASGPSTSTWMRKS